MNLRRPVAAVALFLLPSFAHADEPQLRKDVGYLASPETEGRGIGTKGIDKAADYLEGRMKSIGLEPAFGKSYRQPFPIKTGVALDGGNELKGVATDDWTPLGFSSSGTFTGPIAFVGYGIAAPPLGYDDYAGIDLKGKVAVMLRYEPQEKDDKSVFDGRKPSRWSALRYKVLQARERGALAVVFVTGPLQADEKDRIPALKNDGPESPAGLPVLQLRTSTAQKLLGVDLAQWQKDVDGDLKPRSRVLAQSLSGRVAVKNTFVTTSNLAGLIPGKGALANEVVVIGAHYDHLGYGGEHSMKPNVHAIHPGADDNASGTASILAIAQSLKQSLAAADNRRTILVCLFSGEESGLAGSGYLVDHTPIELARIKAMINLDMVGDLHDNGLAALGAESAPEWKPLVDRTATVAKLNVAASGDGYGPSDQTSFYAQRIPVLHFFTGAHERYHTPEDTADTVNYAGMQRVVDFTTNIAAAVVRGEVTPQYTRVAAAPAMEGDSRGYGAYLGTVPDYRAMDATSGGVLLADVRKGGPADLAGIKGGDRIVEMAGTHIENLYDMTYALQDHKPGSTIDVVVIRNDQRITLRATLGTRGGTPPPEAGQGHGSTVAASGPAPLEIKAGKPYEKTFDGEKHLADVRQLTFGGENAEAYFSPDGRRIIYQATVPGAGCDQEYVMDLATGESKLVSSGKGRTTCGYFSYPNGERIVYATTEGGGEACPPKPDYSKGYVWPVYDSFDIVEANPDGSNVKKLTTEKGYDAEMTWCHKGGKAVFTSMRDGDLELYEWNEKTHGVRRLTNGRGYDGGAFYNADCSEIVWRANRPTAGAALDEYNGLLAQGLVKPLHMELWLMNADGGNQRQITSNGAANFCPFFMPDGKHILFASNVDQAGFQFDLWTVDKEGKNPERITTAPGFDGFPVFSPDGKYVIWSSSRMKPEEHEMNLFIARWVP
jgi:Tol biopolymer transport system component